MSPSDPIASIAPSSRFTGRSSPSALFEAALASGRIDGTLADRHSSVAAAKGTTQMNVPQGAGEAAERRGHGRGKRVAR
jgi:hypothetical protein